MTNNKQQTEMKLYTEGDLKKVISIYSEEYKTSTDEILKELNLTPIELPSNEEIDEKAFQVPYDNTKDFYNLQFIKGAKWMRNKIQGGEQ
jgi:hypothetical protein